MVQPLNLTLCQKSRRKADRRVFQTRSPNPLNSRKKSQEGPVWLVLVALPASMLIQQTREAVSWLFMPFAACSEAVRIAGYPRIPLVLVSSEPLNNPGGRSSWLLERGRTSLHKSRLTERVDNWALAALAAILHSPFSLGEFYGVVVVLAVRTRSAGLWGIVRPPLGVT